MGRAPCCDKMGIKKGPWTAEEDRKLITYIRKYGHGNWRCLPKQAGLLRCGKSCRLRWTNYLRPDLKRGNFTPQDEHTIVQLHQIIGNRWSTIASFLPGRTDNEIKNVWNTRLKKRVSKSCSEVDTPKYSCGTRTAINPLTDFNNISSFQTSSSDEFNPWGRIEESACQESKWRSYNSVDEAQATFVEHFNSEMEQLFPSSSDPGCNSSNHNSPAEQIELSDVNSAQAHDKISVSDYINSLKLILEIDDADAEQTSNANFMFDRYSCMSA